MNAETKEITYATRQCETIFSKELNLIKNRERRDWVISMFGRLCPDTFWTQPASTTGKYHPRVSSGEGGLVRHTKLAVWWGLELAKALKLLSLNDETVAALLLHDVHKRHDNVGTHGLELEHAIRELMRRLCNEEGSCDSCLFRHEGDTNFVTRVTDAIAYHMGIWTQGYDERQTTEIVQLIHLADYCASRKVDEKLEKLSGDHRQEADENLLTQAYDLVRRVSGKLYDYTSPNVVVHKAVLAADRELLNRALVLLALVSPKSREESSR